jgi:hypothetical protein
VKNHWEFPGKARNFQLFQLVWVEWEKLGILENPEKWNSTVIDKYDQALGT